MKRNVKKVMLACVTMLVGIMLCGCGETKVSLNEFMTYEVVGADGYGKVQSELDKSKLEDYLEAIAGESLYSVWDGTEWVFEKINGSWDKTENLSNGDKITYTWDVNKDFLKEKYDIVLTCEDIVYKVDGLDEVSTFDPFEYVTVSFTGTSPSGEVILQRTADAPSDYSFTADRESRLSNGDEVTVSFGISNVDSDVTSYCAEYYGEVPSQTSKTYTVEGLETFVGTIADIPQSGMDEMIKQAEDEIKANAANWSDDASLKDVENVGCFLLNAKDVSLNEGHNYLYVIEMVTTSNPDVNGEFNYLYYTRYQDVKIKEDGTLDVDLYNPVLPDGGSFFGDAYGEAFKTGEYYYVGYSNYDELYENCVTQYTADYTVESTADEPAGFVYFGDKKAEE